MVGLMPDLFRNGALMERGKPADTEQIETVQYSKAEEVKESSSELVTFTPSKQQEGGTGGAFHGHFDMTIASMQEQGLLSDRGSYFQSSEISFSISFDLKGYLSEGLTPEDQEGLKEIFQGDVFEEFKDSFYGLLEGEEGLDAFSEEVDDLFGKAAEVLDLDDQFFEDVKTMFLHSAIIFTDQIEQQEAEQQPVTELPRIIKDNTAAMLEDLGTLHTLLEQPEKGMQRFKDGLMLNPSPPIFDRLADLLGAGGGGYATVEERDNQLAKTLQSLQRQARNIEKFLNR